MAVPIPDHHADCQSHTPLTPFSQDLRPVGGDGDGVLKVRGSFAGSGLGGPAVGQRLYAVAFQGNHRLDGDSHPLCQPRAVACFAEVGDFRILMERPAYAVADKFPDDAIAELADMSFLQQPVQWLYKGQPGSP